MRSKFIRCISVVLTVLLLLPAFAGCASKAQAEKTKLTNVFKGDSVLLPSEISYINQCGASSDSIYFTYSDYNYDSETGTSNNTLYVYKAGITGGDPEIIMTLNQNDSYVNGFCVTADGSIIMGMNVYHTDEETGEYTSANYIDRYNSSGELVLETNCADIFGADSNVNFYNVRSDSVGNIYLLSDQTVYRINTENALNGKVSVENDVYINNIMIDSSDRVYIYYNNQTDSTSIMARADFDAGNVGEKLPASSVGNYIYNLQTPPSGSSYDFIYNNNSGVCGYDIETDTSTEILNWVNSDFNSNYITNFFLLDNEHIVVLQQNYDAGGNIEMLYLTHVPDDEVVEKYTITLAAIYLDYRLKQAVIDYNKTNEEYQIELLDYSIYNTDADGKRGVTMLNNDIIAGNVPDIIQLDESMPVSSYISKGLFADLYTYIENDETINLDDYLTNIFDAYAIDGKLYQLVPSFNIQTVVGKKSLIGDITGWTMDEFNAVLKQHPDAIAFFDMTQDNLLSYITSVTIGQFVNRETGVCSFDSEEFIKLLEFANNLSQSSIWENFNYEDYDENFWNDMNTAYRDGRVLLQVIWMSSYRSYWEQIKGNFGDDISLPGFPSADRNGSAIVSSMQLAMYSKCKLSDGAWSFMRYVLTDEFQDAIDYNFPVKVSSLNKMAENQMKPYSYTDENGVVTEYPTTYYIDGENIEIGEITQEYVDKLNVFIRSLNQVQESDDEMYSIIQEEAAAYFAGSKTVEETVKIIQNRVSIYVSETR